MAARDTALSALIAIRTKNAWADGVLKEYLSRDKLDRREASLASRLTYGVVQNRMLLDFYIASCLNGKLKDLQPVVLDILRLGMYQITMMDKVPASAAVNEAVKQGKRYANVRASGLINGVLRAAERKQLPEPESLAVRYSHPEPLVKLLSSCVPQEKLEPLLKSHNEAPDLTVQVNTLKTTTEALCELLQAQEIAVQRHPWLPDCLTVSGSGNLEQLESFREGLFYVQDAAAKLPVLAAGLRPGDRVLDCCAAPGGKSFAACIAMGNQGELIACDLHPHKIPLIEKGAQRLGIEILRAEVQNAAQQREDFVNSMDCVIADVPCSGLGVIRKKPDIRYKDLCQIAELPKVQLEILRNQASYVKPGGTLIYSTCTIVPAENEDVISAFLQEMPDFSCETLTLPVEETGHGMVTMYPCDHGTDGFYICKMRRAR